MKEHHLKDLNKNRKGVFYKNPVEENFLEELNRHLFPREQATYKNLRASLPHIFIFGLPRSGTTLLSQVIAHGLDVGYIDNIAARFWLAPLHGIKLSQAILKDHSDFTFDSKYGTTVGLKDIHEFGYFWRYWLKKNSLESIKNSVALEDDIEWGKLSKTLGNIQAHFGKPMIYKNIFGAYHISRLSKVLNQNAIWLYIERDEKDVAQSILQARKKYYGEDNIKKWWSTAPIEIDELLHKKVEDQIAGQIFYMKQYYNEKLNSISEDQYFRLNYKDLCSKPYQFLEHLANHLQSHFNVGMNVTGNIPRSFQFKEYSKDNPVVSNILRKIEYLRTKDIDA